MATETNKKIEVFYLLPLKWSLHYVMIDKEWQNFRNGVKKSNPDWAKCTCPKQCKANSLDEDWNYDYENHIKHFVRAKFICNGCHWLKTPPWRDRDLAPNATGRNAFCYQTTAYH